MEEFLQRTKSKLDRAKQLEKIHVVIGNKCCDLDSIISTLTYAYYLDKTSSPSILCLPVLNSSRVEFSFYSETRFILEELDIPESFLIFKDEISLQHLNDEGKLLLTLININTLISEDASLEASIVKVINPDNRLDGVQAFHESSSSLVAKKILEEAPELITRQLAHLLRGSILFSCLSVEHEIIPTQLEDILYMLEEKFPELPPRQDIISCLQETKLHTQGTNVDEIILNDYKELSDGDIKVAISTIYMMLEDLMSCRNIIGDLKLFVDKCGFDVLILLASSTPEEQPKMQQIAVYSESPELCNQVCCELEECQSPFLDMEPSDYGCERFYVYQQQNSFITSDQVAAIIKEAINRRRIGIHPNSRTSSTEAVAGSAPLSQGSSGIMELYGSDLDPQPNPVNFADNPQEVNGSVLPQVDINVDLVSPDSGLATIRSSRSSKESSVFLSDDSPVAEVAGPHQSFLAGADSYSPIPEGIIAEEATPPSRNNSDNLDIYNFDLAPNLRSESSSHSADYSMADDFFFHSDSSEGQQPVALKGQDEQNLYPGNIADCSTVLLNDNVENISLVEFDDDFMQSPESHEDFCEKNPPLSDIVEYDSPLSSEILGNLDVKIPPTPMNSLVESSPLDNGPPTFFPEDVIDKINEIGTNDSSQSQSKYVYWWNAGESNSAYETLMDADTWSSGEQELLFHSPVSCKDQKAKPSVKDNFGITLDCNRENTRENQGVKECKENTFSDLWKSSQSLPMMSDPWNVSAEVLLRDAKETANTWYTTEENNEPCFAKGSAIDEIHTDCSSENTPDNAIGNRISQELFERNQFLFKPHNDEKQGAVPKSKVLNPEINTTGDLGQPQNIYAWDLYDDSEPSRIVNLPMKWEDPFFSYSCMDFAVANTVKDAFVSSPDTNYSTSDSNISPTFGEEMKELEIPLEQKKIFDHTEKRKSENQTFNDAFHSHGENVIYPIKDTIKPPSETVQPGNEKSNSVNILVQNCMTHSEGTENINFAQSCILKLENRQDNNQMNNQRVSFRDESIFKCGEHQDISLNGKGLVGEAGPNNLPLGKNVHSILATPQHGEHTEISGITTNLCPFSKIGSDASCINKEQSDIANNTSVLHGSSVAAILPVDTECLPSQFPDKMVNTLSIKKEENVYELHSRKTLENEEVLHITSVVTENHDSPEPDLEEDTESSSLNTPDEIESPDSACLGKWNLLSKPLQDVIETQGTIGVQKTHTIDDNSQDEIRESKASNPDNRYSPSNQFSINPEANNSNKIHASNIYLESEDQFLNRQIKMEENVLFSNTSSVNYLQPMCFGVSDFVSQNGTCEDVWANTVSGNFDSADTDSDLSSGVSNKYLKEDLKHDTSNDKNTLSCSSHSSASSPEFDDSWGVLQENAHDTYLCTNKEKMPLSKNNDECFDMTATGVSKLTKEPITCNVLNKVPMNLDIWNTPVCEDSESSSTSPEENCSLYHSSMLERTAKHYSEDRQRKIENTDSVLFSEHQSNTTTADANYSLEICQTQLDCFYNYCSNDEFNVKTNKQTNQGLSLDTSLEKSILSEGCLADTNFTSVNKLQLGNCALESHNDDDKNTRKSKEALPPCEYAAKNGFSNNTLKHSTEILDWWKTDQQTGRNLEEESSQNNKQYRNNWMDKPNESINIVSLISLPRDHQSPTYFFEDSSSKFENPISSYAKNTQSMQYSPPNRNHGFNVDQLFLGDFNGVQKGPACVPLQIGTPNSCNSIAVPNICNNIFQTSRSPDCCTEYEVDQAYENEFETRIHSTHRTEVEVDKTLLQNVYLQKENNTSHLGNQLNEKITEAEVKNISETSNSHTSSAYKSFNDKLQNMCLTVPAELCQQSSILEVSGQIKKMLEPGLPLKQVDTTPELRDDAVWSSHISPEGGDIGSHKEFVEGLNPGLSNSRTVETSPVDEVTYGGFQSSSPDVIVHSFPLMDTNVTESGKAHSVNLPDTFHAISMTNTSEKQASPKSEYHSLGLEEKPSSIIPQRLASEKKSEDISEQEHSWSIILSQTEVSDSSPEDIFSRSVDSDKELSHSVHQGYAKSDKYQSESKDHEYTDLEESFEMCKIDSKPPVELHSSEADMRYMKHPEDGEAVKQLITGGAQREVLLDDVGMDIPFDAAEFRPEPPNSLDLNGSHTRKIKLTAPNINLSLDHSEGSILSDDNLDTPDELDINVDDLDTPDEADSFDYTGQDDRPALGEAAPENFESIQEYTAEEERSDNRLWRTVVIGEQEQRIDMKAIEPYKKVISHGGYYGEGVNAIIVFSACFLPDSSCSDYNYVMENLFLYVISTLELMVAEDYMIVYLNGATPRRKMPGLGWMKKCYQMIDRRLRKNLKSFIIVHPSWFIRTILAVTRPFISSKFSSKIKYVSTLAELRELIPMDYVQIPESIIKLDEELKEDESNKAGCLPGEPEITSLDHRTEKKNGDSL